jgi:hypothetical protein
MFLTTERMMKLREPERFQVCEATKKELKIKIQKDVTTYLTYSLPLCGILGDERQYHWFYNHFIQLYTLSGNQDNFWIDYLEDRDFYRDIVEYAILDWECLRDEADIIGYLEDRINSGYYVIIFVDEYYLPTDQNYHRTHYLHQRLVYGYDKTNQLLKSIGFDGERNFINMVYSYDDFRKAYDLGKSYYDVSEPWVKKENVELIKPKFEDYNFSLPSFLADLKEYLSGEGDYSRIRPMNLEVFGKQAVFNIHAVDDFLRNPVFDGVGFRYMYLVAEHKEVMSKRLKFITNDLSLVALPATLLEQYDQIKKRLLISRNFFLKEFIKEKFEHDKSGAPEILRKITDICQWGKKEECLVLERIYRILSSV